MSWLRRGVQPPRGLTGWGEGFPASLHPWRWEDVGCCCASVEPAGQLWSYGCSQRDFSSAEWYYPPRNPSPCAQYFQHACAGHPSSVMIGRTQRLSNLVNYLSIIRLPDVHIMLCSE